ncbi:AAA family ATPase [Candidatus Sumerlaeota bacterium]|nr:AAA family ATPase [Candidatus Sumerlaeota bacterium]
MLTRIYIRNFKKLKEIDIPLGDAVVFIGPNNSGKTTALQALALWDIGIRAWNAKREGKSSPEKRPGVPINRRDLISTPAPVANMLWHGLHVRRAKTNGVDRGTQNIRIDVSLSGVTKDVLWQCGLEFDFTNEESFVCRPLRLPGFEDVPVTKAKFSTIPQEATQTRFAFLPPMSGLTAEEPLLQPGRINVLIGEGQTAQVLRNLCYQITENDKAEDLQNWKKVTSSIKSLFGVHLFSPIFLDKRGEITLQYEENGVDLDISAAGRGLQQTLLLLVHLYANPNTVLLLDEPDAHLEILRQREIFRIITEVAKEQGSQIIAASHSEVVLNEASSKGTVVAFVGKPHLLNDRGAQTLKALTDIGWDQYYQAEQAGWILYLEGPSDLEILRSFALTLGHEKAVNYLSRPFVYYIGTDQPQKCRDHFYGLREAKSDLAGISLVDRIERRLDSDKPLVEMMWKRREIENYFCTKEVLISYAKHDRDETDIFGLAEVTRRIKAMEESIEEVVNALETLGKPNMTPWSPDIKASDDFLEPIFKKFFKKLKLPILLRKTNYHILAKLLPKEQIDSEIIEKLDAIVSVAEKAVISGE